MRFDQGMGYWHVSKRADASFPFAKPADIQIKHLLNLCINIMLFAMIIRPIGKFETLGLDRDVEAQRHKNPSRF